MMTAEKPSPIVPNLRFPEFREAGEWRLHKFGDFVVKSFYGTSAPTSETGQYPVLRMGNMGDGVLDFSNLVYIDLAPEEFESFRLQKGDILLNRTNSRDLVGKISIFDRDSECVTASYIVSFRLDENRIDPWFCNLMLNTQMLQSLIKQLATPSISQANINPTTFRTGLDIVIPKLAEQQKIADCLGSLDDLIAAEGRKLEALRQHKQGLMQQLFPQPGKTVPRLRFPEFHNAGEWEEEKLDDLAKRGTGHTPNKAKAEYYNGGIKWVSLADSKRLDNGLISETAIEISEEGINNSSAVLHPAGSVILSRDAGVGKSAIISSSMAVSQHFVVWTCDPTILSNWFLYYQLQLLKPLFERIATGSTIKTIGLPFFNTMRIIIPRLAEQRRIAACLSSLDARLDAQLQKLTALQTHKQGLLQQLFPSLEGSE